jgi:hypothetical protein
VAEKRELSMDLRYPQIGYGRSERDRTRPNSFEISENSLGSLVCTMRMVERDQEHRGLKKGIILVE